MEDKESVCSKFFFLLFAQEENAKKRCIQENTLYPGTFYEILVAEHILIIVKNRVLK